MNFYNWKRGTKINWSILKLACQRTTTYKENKEFYSDNEFQLTSAQKRNHARKQ